MSKTIEIFTDSSRFSNDLENLVKEYACSKCSIIVYDASNPQFKKIMETKTAEYSVTSLPAVTISGKLVPIDKLNKGKFSNFIRDLIHKSPN